MKNAKGQFMKGHVKSKDEMIKTKESLKESWKERETYVRDIKHPKIYNCWRAFRYTTKGKKIGNSESWNDYRTFYNDMIDEYFEKATLIRLDKSLPFSKENCIWVHRDNQNKLNNRLVRLDFNGKSLTLVEASLLPEANNTTYIGIKCRYYNKDKYDYTVEEIITGNLEHNKERRTKGKIKQIVSTHDLNVQLAKNKASKMVSSYRSRDRKKGLGFNLDTNWLLENILYKNCFYCGTIEKIGCDRIDNNIGHLKDNVIPCCTECNTVRNNLFSVNEMKLLAETIKIIKQNRLK